MKKMKIAVLGLGKVGQLVAQLLADTGYNVTGMDRKIPADSGVDAEVVDVSNAAQLKKKLSAFEAVVSCLPYHLNLLVAKIAAEKNIHYFDLTEDVATTEAIRKLSKNADCVMVPQCGLAPGFIGIVGASLAKNFAKLRSMELRVGALPQHPRGELGYAFNWSAEGVVNEYLNDCEVIRDGVRNFVPAMQDLETIVIGGRALEAFTTSGGLGTLCETFAGKIDALNYKTMRYPGHMRLMRFFFHELHLRNDRAQAGKILLQAKPPVSDDVVYVHAAVEGWNEDSVLKREEFVRRYFPIYHRDILWRAISWTTASSVAAVVEMVLSGKLKKKGFLRQEQISLADFLATENGRRYANYAKGE
jgi:saccharopine dehydrogenase-like NADP-dependent oxidoreductase